MRTFKIIFFVFIGLVLVAIAAVAALVFVDPSIYRNQLETRASAAFARPFKIEGPINLERSLRPRIILEEITIGNPDWAAGAHFAVAEKVGIQVALLALLRGKLNVLDVSFSGVNLYIEEGPDGANNYTFGDRGAGEKPGVLPAIERLVVKDTVINYRSADGGSKRFDISEVRLWNIPGEPERIEGRGAFKGKTFTIQMAADTASELTGPERPWSVKLDLEGPDMALTIAGRMLEAFKWERGDYGIKISGKQADSIEDLFGVQFPTSGPFELSANVNKDEAAFRVTDIAAQINGPPDTPAIKISTGEASGGQKDPFQIELQGQYGTTPFAFSLASMQPFGDISQTTPFPLEARLDIADTKLMLEGTLIPATVAERLEFEARLEGQTLTALAQLLDAELPAAGPYQLSFRTNIEADNYRFTDLKGHIKGTELWQMIQIVGGEASALESGAIIASIDARLDNIPLSLAFQGGPMPSGNSGATSWPVKLTASASGAKLTGEGSIVTTGDQRALKMATQINANRFESLGPLIGASLPAIGKFNLRADVGTDGDVHEINNLQVQMGVNRLDGSIRWEDKAPRPALTAKLSSESLISKKFFATSSKPSSKSRPSGLLDRPIKLEALKGFDARVDLEVKRLADSPISVADLRSTLTLANGQLNAPFRASLAGAPVDGQIQLGQDKNLAAVSLKGNIGHIDVGQTLKQLKLPDIVTGTADAIEVEGSSRGKTLRALGEQAVVNVQIKPANLAYTVEITNQTVAIQVESATLAARKDQPLTASLKGMVQEVAFNAEVSTASLKEIRKENIPLPLKVAIQTKDLRFKTEGSIARPFEKQEFDLQYELAGEEIEGIDPLVDFAIPLRGEFSARGRITGRGNRFTYEEDLRVGKSDLKAEITVLREPPRPKITGRIVASQIHMDDVELFDADKETASTQENARVIPDYTLPVEALLAADLDLEIKAERIRAPLGDLGDFVSKISLKDGRFNSSFNLKGFVGARINSEFDLNATADPPLIKVQIKAKDMDFGYFLNSMDVTDLVKGQIDLHVNLSGAGATRYNFLGNATGRITIIGGPGQITGRRIDLWAADLIPTMLSTSWQREN
ncbi:MAG: AsmA family protein, partial [Desulfobacterales bacterium]